MATITDERASAVRVFRLRSRSIFNRLRRWLDDSPRSAAPQRDGRVCRRMAGPSLRGDLSPNDRAHEGDPPSPQAQGEGQEGPQEGGHRRGQEARGQALAGGSPGPARGREQDAHEGEGEYGGPNQPSPQARRLL